MKRLNQLKNLLMAIILLTGFGMQTHAQEVDDLQAYLDKLAAEQPVEQARQRVVKKDGEVVIPVGLTEVDLSKFASYQSRKKVLEVKTSVRFTNGTITAASDFSGGTSLLRIYGGATVVIDETAGVDASAASTTACTQAVRIEGGSSFYQQGDVIAAGLEEGIAIYLASADDSYYYISGKIIGRIVNPYGGTVVGVKDLSNYVKELQDRMNTFTENVNALQQRVVAIKEKLSEMTTGTEFFMRKADGGYNTALNEFNSLLAVNQTYIAGLIEAFNKLVNTSVSTMAEAENLDKSLKELEDMLPTADNDLKTTEAELANLVTKYEALDVNFPTQDQVYSLVPNTGVSRKDIQMGYKSNRGFVLTSAGMMFFEQDSRADFRLRDQNDNYVVVKDGSSFLTAGTKEEAAIWTGINLGNGIYRFYHKATKQYLTCSGNTVNAKMMLGSAIEWKITESDLDELQAFLNMLAEEEEAEQGEGGSGTTENDILDVFIPKITCVGCNTRPWVFPKVPHILRVVPTPGYRTWEIPNPNPGLRRPDNWHPIYIPNGSHVIIDDVTIADNFGGGHVIYVEGIVEINVNVIINIMNWDWFIHVGPTGKVIWRPGKGADPNWIPPRIKVDKGGTVEIVDGGYIGYVDNTGTIKHTGGTIEQVVNRTTYIFSGGLINFMDNYGTQTQTGGVVWKVYNREGSTYNMSGGEIYNYTENTTDVVFTNYGTFKFTGGTLGGYGKTLIYHGPKGTMWLDGGKFIYDHITTYFIEAYNVFHIRGDYEVPERLTFLLNPSVYVYIINKWIYKWNFTFVGGLPTSHFPLFYGEGFNLTRDYIKYINWVLPNYRWRWYFHETNFTIEPRDESVRDEDDLQNYLNWLAEHQGDDAASTEEKPQELDLGGREIIITKVINIPVGVHVWFKNGTFRPKGAWTGDRVFVIPKGSTVRYEKVIFDFSSSTYYYVGGKYVQIYLFDVIGKVFFGEGCHIKGYINTEIAATDSYIPGAVFRIDPTYGYVYLNGGRFDIIVFYATTAVRVYVSVNLLGNIYFYLPTACRVEGLRLMAPWNSYKFVMADSKIVKIWGAKEWSIEIDKEGFLSIFDLIARYDVNGDKKLDAMDIADMVRLMLGTAPENVNRDIADINDDNKVNIADIMLFTNILTSLY